MILFYLFLAINLIALSSLVHSLFLTHLVWLQLQLLDFLLGTIASVPILPVSTLLTPLRVPYVRLDMI